MIYNFENLTFNVLLIDKFSHRDGYFSVNARPYAALSFRKSGKGRFEIDNKEIITREGDVLFLPADMPYKVEYSGSESIVIHFEKCNYFEAENIPLSRGSIGLKFQRLLEAWNGRHSVNLAKSIIYEILENIERDKMDEAEDSVFSRSLRYIDEHFTEPTLDIAEICKTGFISPSSLQRAFCLNMGLSPKQYLGKLRMNRALELLAENRLSVKEIAYATGFRDEKYFSRAFKKQYGCAPSKMQNNMLF